MLRFAGKMAGCREHWWAQQEMTPDVSNTHLNSGGSRYGPRESSEYLIADLNKGGLLVTAHIHLIAVL